MGGLPAHRHFLARNMRRVAFPPNATSSLRRIPSIAPQEGLPPSRLLSTLPHPSLTRNTRRVAFGLPTTSLRQIPSVAPLPHSSSLSTPLPPLSRSKRETGSLPAQHHLLLVPKTLRCPTRGLPSLQIAFDTPTPLSRSKRETGSLRTTHHLLTPNTLHCPSLPPACFQHPPTPLSRSKRETGGLPEYSIS